MWYYRNKSSQAGPLTEGEFIKLIQMGIINEKDEIWMMKMANWMRLEDTIYSFYIIKPSEEKN